MYSVSRFYPLSGCRLSEKRASSQPSHPGIWAQGEQQHGGADEQEDRQTVSGDRRTKVHLRNNCRRAVPAKNISSQTGARLSHVCQSEIGGPPACLAATPIAGGETGCARLAARRRGGRF